MDAVSVQIPVARDGAPGFLLREIRKIVSQARPRMTEEYFSLVTRHWSFVRVQQYGQPGIFSDWPLLLMPSAG